MDDILLKSVKIIAKNSPFHLQIKNVSLKDGIITSITNTDENTEATQVVHYEGACLSVGWFDMRAVVPAMGLEYKEDINSACEAAMHGGFTEIATLPVSQPAIQTKEAIHFILRHSESRLCSLYPIAAASTDTKGEEMTEMLDLHTAGAVAFSDGLLPTTNTSLIIKILQYLSQFEGLFINMPDEKNLSKQGMMHEGLSSTLLGMKGLPSLAEEMGIIRDLKLLSYAGGKIHFSGISCAESVQLIREAKKQGLPITADIAAHQLAFTDEDLKDFDTNLKVKPPFRTQRDIQALIEGLSDDTIDAIVSDHQPQDEESKCLEFDLAEFGIIGLETAFAVANTFGNKLPIEKLIEKITYNPRQILKVSQPQIAVGEMANLTLFNPSQSWEYKAKDICSKSKNSPFAGRTLEGEVLGVFNKGKTRLFM
ncbi:MAG: dihydroorotase [Cytophagales bacterium]|nr:MAG: dihydroorotase [Cytophagales bacterium]